MSKPAPGGGFCGVPLPLETAGAGAEESLAALPLEAGEDAAIEPRDVRRRGTGREAGSGVAGESSPAAGRGEEEEPGRGELIYDRAQIGRGPQLGLEPIWGFPQLLCNTPYDYFDCKQVLIFTLVFLALGHREKYFF